MYSQCDPDRNQYVLLDDIIGFCKTNPALSIEDQNIFVKGRAYLRRWTVGWQVCCQWKDGLTSWENISDLKESLMSRLKNMPIVKVSLVNLH